VNAVIPMATTEQQHYTAQEIVTDEDLEQLLYCDGELAPGLIGNDEEGVPKIERAREMLQQHRAAFCKDPKNPPVTHHEI
jgi:hypothetical protein